jgi:hypothetical protein
MPGFRRRWLSGLAGLGVAMITGCMPDRQAEEPPQDVPQQSGGNLERHGRIYPNLVLHQDSEKGTEFWIKLEIGLDSLGSDTIARIHRILRRPVPDSLLVLDSLITPQMDKQAEKPRRAFRDIIRCAIQDNIDKMANTAQRRCREMPQI